MALGMGIERERGCSRKWVRGSLIGVGASATVNLAMNKANGELFAVKSMSTDCISCLENEYNILNSLDSPYIVRCTGIENSVEDGNEMCNLLMEYMPGGSVAELMNKFGGRLEESVIRAYTSCILKGLEYLHGQGIVHCDVKAKNVLVGTGGVKLADFGSAKRKEKKGVSIEDSWQLRGTPLWMAPEVVNQVEQGPASDIWSLGCTVLEMATGKAPWSNVRDPLVAMYRIGCSNELPEFPLCLSSQGRDFLEKCLRRDPSQRWTAAQLLSHPFLNENTCFATKVLNPPLSPRSALDLEHSVWDSCSSGLSVTVPTLSMDISKPAGKVDAEMVNKSGNLKRPLKSSPKDRVMALAAGCEKPAWCSTPFTGQWIVVRSSSNSIPTSNSNSVIEAECGSSLEPSDEKLQSTDGRSVAENLGEEDQLQLGQLDSWPITEHLNDRAEETNESSPEHVHAIIQCRVGGNIIHYSAIHGGENFSLSFDMYSEQICPKLFSTGQLYISFARHNSHDFTHLTGLLLIWVHVNLTNSNSCFFCSNNNFSFFQKLATEFPAFPSHLLKKIVLQTKEEGCGHGLTGIYISLFVRRVGRK